MISKECFCNALQMIQEQSAIDQQFGKALELVVNGHFVYGTENKYLRALLNVLKEDMKDQYDYIEWWLYEASDNYEILEADGKKKYVLKEPAALYDYMNGTLEPIHSYH